MTDTLPTPNITIDLDVPKFYWPPSDDPDELLMRQQLSSWLSTFYALIRRMPFLHEIACGAYILGRAAGQKEPLQDSISRFFKSMTGRGWLIVIWLILVFVLGFYSGKSVSDRNRDNQKTQISDCNCNYQ